VVVVVMLLLLPSGIAGVRRVMRLSWAAESSVWQNKCLNLKKIDFLHSRNF
jgi:hypothetical protein